MNKLVTLSLLFLSCIVSAKHKGPHYKVHCTPHSLKVDLVKHEDVTAVYLQHLKDYPEPACKPELVGSRATFLLSLDDIYQCMVTRVRDRNTGREVFYHRVVLEYGNTDRKDAFMVKCDSGLSPLNVTAAYDVEVEQLSLVKRQAEFPDNFREDDYVEITGEVEGRAPIPVLNVGVRQEGTLIDNELNVKPGTPLNMEVYLDSASRAVYGLMVTGMEVTDTGTQSEPILVNGCSVDPYLFENFETQDGDFLKAKFRAFKFPQSPFVLFKGTVNVCLDSCAGVQCSNGQRGFGRRRREVPGSPDPNKVYEISMSTVIKMECDDCTSAKFIEEDTLSHIREKVEYRHSDEAALSALFQEFGSARYVNYESTNTASFPLPSVLPVVLLSLVALLGCHL